MSDYVYGTYRGIKLWMNTVEMAVGVPGYGTLRWDPSTGRWQRERGPGYSALKNGVDSLIDEKQSRPRQEFRELVTDLRLGKD